MDMDQTIVLWLRRTKILADWLMVDPADVYSTLVERGYTEERARATITADQSVALVASIFRPEETLTLYEITRRVEKHKELAPTKNLDHYVRLILSRHSDGKGKRRFRRVIRGGYRLQLSTPELRSAITRELRDQRQFVGSKRLMEMFEVSYESLVDVLAPLVKSREVVSITNSRTQSRDWSLPQYADTLEQ